MARDGETIQTIFNPRKVRAPSVVVTNDSPNGPFGGFTPQPQSGANNPTSPSGGGGGGGAQIQQHPPPITHSDSVASSQTHDGDYPQTPRCDTPLQNQQLAVLPTQPPAQTQTDRSRLRKCRESCCSEGAQKMYFGVCVTILVTASWVGSAHSIKYLYLFKPMYPFTSLRPETTFLVQVDKEDNDNTTKLVHTFSPTGSSTFSEDFLAPFFASWFFANFTIFFFPIYILGRSMVKKCDGTGEALGDILRGIRDRGFTVGRFLNACLSFAILWVTMTYILVLSLKSLLATELLALFATNVASVYLLSWVILHEQFVGVRIVAVILCDTGIALLAYMDGITNSPTLGGVVLAALSAAGYAVFKVMFRKVMGDPPIGQIAFTFTIIGILNATVLWPICVGLYLSGKESMPWDPIPWIILLIASILLLVFHVLMQFSNAVTYSMFVTLGLITSVPVSAALDVVLYGAEFYGMKLSGIILIVIGFFLVMLPNNWPDYITRLLRIFGRACLRSQCCCDYADMNYEDSKYHLVGPQRELTKSKTQIVKNLSRQGGSPKTIEEPQMGPPSSKRNSWSWSDTRRLSNGFHPFSAKKPERTDKVMENEYVSLDSQQFNLNLTKPMPNYSAGDRPRHSISVTETRFITNAIESSKEQYSSLE